MPVCIQCTAATTMKHLRDPLLEEGQLFHSCARNISGRSRFCICTRYCTQLPTQEGELQVPAVNMVLLLVKKGGITHKVLMAQGNAELGNQCQVEPAHGSFWNPLSLQRDHLPLERHGSFTELGLGRIGKLRVKGHSNKRNKVTCNTHHA